MSLFHFFQFTEKINTFLSSSATKQVSKIQNRKLLLCFIAVALNKGQCVSVGKEGISQCLELIWVVATGLEDATGL